MSQQTFAPKFLRASDKWGYAAPPWSTGKMRVRLDWNDYQQKVWIVEAEKATSP